MNAEYLLIVGEKPEMIGPFATPDESERTLRKRLQAAGKMPSVVLSIYYAYGTPQARIEPLNAGYLDWLRNETGNGPYQVARR